MVSLTPDFFGNTLIFTIGYGIFAIGVTIYTLILNWKQAKVKEQMTKLIEIMEKIEKNTQKANN